MQKKQITPKLLFFSIFLCFFLGSCSKKPVSRTMETTAYCGCSICCSWERGSWIYLKLDFWNRYVSAGKGTGRDYTGQTANGAYPNEPEEGFFSMDSLHSPWMLPTRLVLFPWYLNTIHSAPECIFPAMAGESLKIAVEPSKGRIELISTLIPMQMRCNGDGVSYQ